MTNSVDKPVKIGFRSWQTITFLSLFFGYIAYYLCRSNFMAASPSFMSDLGFSKENFGAIISCGVFVYALGKFTNGVLGDLIGGRKIFLIGLFISALATLFLGTVSIIVYFFIFWSINRFFQSMGWVGLIKIMASWFKPDQQGTAMGLMSVNYLLGDFLSRNFVALLLIIGLSWRGCFIVPALVLIGVGVILSFLLKNTPSEVGHVLPLGQTTETEAAGEKTESTDSTAENYAALMKKLLCDYHLWMIIVLSVVLTFSRVVFNTWNAIFFYGIQCSASQSASFSSWFPLLGAMGTIFAGWYSDKFSGARRAPVMAALLILCTFILLMLSALPSSRFTVEHFKDIKALAGKIRDAHTPMQQHIRKLLTQKTLHRLADYDVADPMDTRLKATLVTEFNNLLTTNKLYNKELFPKFKLTQGEEKNLKDPKNKDFIRLNRLLLERAYPEEIIKLQDWPSYYWSLPVSLKTLAMILMAALGFCLLGPYSMLGGVCAIDFGGPKAVATVAGLIDGMGYLASALAGIGIAKLLQGASWSYVFAMMSIMTSICTLCTFFFWNIKPRAMQGN